MWLARIAVITTSSATNAITIPLYCGRLLLLDPHLRELSIEPEPEADLMPVETRGERAIDGVAEVLPHSRKLHLGMTARVGAG